MRHVADANLGQVVLGKTTKAKCFADGAAVKVHSARKR